MFVRRRRDVFESLQLTEGGGLLGMTPQKGRRGHALTAKISPFLVRRAKLGFASQG